MALRIAWHAGTQPYEFVEINVHLYFGNYIADRRQEFDTLTEWMLRRRKTNTKAYYPNFILLVDRNVDYDNPKTDRARIEQQIKSFNTRGQGPNVDIPFLDIHPTGREIIPTNTLPPEAFDSIGLFSRDPRFPTSAENAIMGTHPYGPDYGVLSSANCSARRC